MPYNPLNVYDSPLDFINPDNRPPTPLVDVTEALDLFPARAKVRIKVKLMTEAPFHSIKWYPGYNMPKEAHKRGELAGVHTLVEASSGNMIVPMWVTASMVGVKHMVAVVPWDIAPQKLEQLAYFGVEVIRHRETPERTCIDVARELGEQPGWRNLNQYANPDNPGAHEKWTGPQIWEQTNGKVTMVFVGMGTTGTLVGIRKALPTTVAVVGVMLHEDNPVPGMRPESKLQPHFDWNSGIDHVKVSRDESFVHGIRYLKAALAVGPTSGADIAGMKQFVQAVLDDHADENFRNEDGEIVCVVLASDLAALYFDRYSAVLGPEYFSGPVANGK